MSAGGDEPKPWHAVVRETLKQNDVRLVPYVPDRVLTPLIKGVHEDGFFTAFATTREEEAVGIVAGAWMAGLRGAVLMQTSGFATLANVLASLVVPCQIPLVMIVSERGTLGEFNLGQAMVCRTMRPVLDALGIESHTLQRLDEVAFIVDRSIKQALATQAPCALILSPLLTGGKAFSQRSRHGDARRKPSHRGNLKVMNRFDADEAARRPARPRRSRRRRHRQHQFRPLGGRPAAAELLHARQHGARLPDRAWRRAGAAGAWRRRARGRRLAPDAARLPVDVAMLAPKNLAIVVMDNGCYQITGGQPTATAAAADLVAIARGCGLSQSAWAADEGMFEGLLARALDERRPVADRGPHRRQARRATTERDPRLIRDRFMQGLGVRR